MKFNKKNFLDLATLVGEIKELKTKESDLRGKCQAQLKTAGLEKLETNLGTFSLYSRSSYEYSGEVDKLESKVKELKKKEESSGIAKILLSETFRFQSKAEQHE